ENAIDAGATAISCEIRDGGITMIRVTDNGSGIEPSQIGTAFLRHATSKISDETDLESLLTLGFRGEALSSIAAVAQVEMITKTRDNLTGIRATNQVLSAESTDQVRLDMEEIGAPDGTTVIVRNLFYNVPVRRKFLRQPQTEAGYVTDLIEHQALSHPGISFHYKVNGQDKLHTTGSGDLKELIYRIYGRDITKRILPLSVQEGNLKLEGFIGRPEISRTSRGFETFFVNGRMLRSDILSKALEEGYRTDLMQHRFPFAVLHLTMPAELTDVNVHPSKMEIHFANRQEIYDFVDRAVHQTLHKVELIPEATIHTDKEVREEKKAEAKERETLFREQGKAQPFEKKRLQQEGRQDIYTSSQGRKGLQDGKKAYEVFKELVETAKKVPEKEEKKEAEKKAQPQGPSLISEEGFVFEDRRIPGKEEKTEERPGENSGQTPSSPASPGTEEGKAGKAADPKEASPAAEGQGTYVQQSLFESVDPSLPEDHIIDRKNEKKYRIIGQVFGTYWLFQYEDKMLMMDQHAAHEKVNFERFMKYFSDNQEGPAPSQMLAPPCVITLTGKEEGAYLQYKDTFRTMGYEIEDLGGGSYAIRSVPMALYGSEPDDLLRETLEEIMEEKIKGTPRSILTRIATMACKASVKGSTLMSVTEAQALIEELMTLDNPYHCPHGRPTIVIMTQRDMDKKFKRIV
ncbi:MAG: DNA mismatch repair endonuclease MutL, partial [Lachnospiraceae bacterium]|nr:DNA mismatch repair endonuclease MutL [Lachnospiraceae bacterium]